MFDILDGLANIQIRFKAAGLKPPAQIILASNEDGHSLMAAIAQTHLICQPGDPRLGKPVEGPDGEPYMQCEIFDMKVLWPAERMALQGGGFKFV